MNQLTQSTTRKPSPAKHPAQSFAAGKAPLSERGGKSPSKPPAPPAEPEIGTPEWDAIRDAGKSKEYARIQQRGNRQGILYLTTEECYELDRTYRRTPCLPSVIRGIIDDGPTMQGEDCAVWEDGRLVAAIRFAEGLEPRVIMLDDPRVTDKSLIDFRRLICAYDREAARHGETERALDDELDALDLGDTDAEEKAWVKIDGRKSASFQRFDRARGALIRAVVTLAGQHPKWFNAYFAEGVRPCSVRLDGRVFAVAPHVHSSAEGLLVLSVTGGADFVDFDGKVVVA
jgi:hypothetical protein